MNLVSGCKWLAALALAAAIGCGGDSSTGGQGGAAAPAGADDAIHIGLGAPLTGSAAALGETLKRGADLMIEQVNAKGGIGGRKIVMHSEDDKGDPNEAVNVARKLANDPRICIVIGHFNSACSNAAKDTYNRAKVVQFTSGSTNVNVCKGSPYTFRNIYRDDYQGIFIANYAKKILGLERMAVLFENDDYGRGLLESFVEEARKQGLNLVAEPIAYNRERTQDFKTLLNALRGQDPQAIFVAGLYNEAALIAKAARQDLGMNAFVMGGDGVMSQDFIKIAGQAAEGAMVVSPFLFNTGQDTPAAQALVEAYRAKYNEEPDTWVALTYDAVGQALKAIEEVGPDRAKIKEWFDNCNTKEKAYDGVTGLTYFNPDGDCYPKLTFVAIVKDGQFTPAPKQLSPDDIGA